MLINAHPPRTHCPLNSKYVDGNVTYKANERPRRIVSKYRHQYFTQICSDGMQKLGTTNRLLRISALPAMVGSSIGNLY